MTQVAGRFTEAAMREAMHQVAARLGVSTDDAHLVRLTNNAVFALPAAGVVIRINRAHGLDERVHRVVRLAGWFAEVGAPTIQLFPGLDQPLKVSSLLATIWKYVLPSPIALTNLDLGQVLRRFHELTPPEFDLPTWNPVRDAHRRLADAEALESHHRQQLVDWCDRLEPRIAEFNQRTDKRLVHGDAHVGNLVSGPDGQALLCDFDSTCLGSWQFDLVPVAVGEARFQRAGVHQALAEAYGFDVATDPDWPLLREARELKMVVGALPYLASAPGVAAEFELRLRSIVEGDANIRWTPFSELSQR